MKSLSGLRRWSTRSSGVRKTKAYVSDFERVVKRIAPPDKSPPRGGRIDTDAQEDTEGQRIGAHRDWRSRTTNLGPALEHWKAGLRPFMERERKAVYKDGWMQPRFPVCLTGRRRSPKAGCYQR
jgi:hypothetical protein